LDKLVDGGLLAYLVTDAFLNHANKRKRTQARIYASRFHQRFRIAG
jgi:hypothetical protein